MPRLRAIAFAFLFADALIGFAACGAFEDAPATPSPDAGGDTGPAPAETGTTDDGGGNQPGDGGGGDGGFDLRSIRYREAVLQDEPLAYWRMGDIENTFTVPDEIGTNDLLLNGSPDFVTGVDGIFANDRAVWFGGTAAWATPAVSTPFAFNGNAPFTLECWARRELLDGGGVGESYQHLVSNVDGFTTAPDGSTQNGYALYIAPNGNRTAAAYGALDGGPMESIGELVPAGEWAHYVMVMDGTNVKLFINGDLAQSLPVKGVISTRPFPLTLAKGSNDPRYFRGYLDEVAIYGKALTILRVKAHFAIARP